jgi:dipeptidyl aminopeptidase/acylaminoacyl peptidase
MRGPELRRKGVAHRREHREAAGAVDEAFTISALPPPVASARADLLTMRTRRVHQERQTGEVAERHTRIWDAETGAQIVVLKGHDYAVRTAAFSPDGRRVVTTSWDKTARIWDVATQGQIAVLNGHDDAVRSAAFSPDGRRVVTASDDKTARFWNVFPTTQDLVDHAEEVVPRCLTRQKRDEAFLETAPEAWCIGMEKWPYHTQDGRTNSSLSVLTPIRRK